MFHFSCAHCQQTLAAQEPQVGQMVLCPQCHHQQTVPPPDKFNEGIVDSDTLPRQKLNTPPPAEANDETKQCFGCDAIIDIYERKCPHCGMHQSKKALRPERFERRDVEPHRGYLLMVLGVLSFLIAPIGPLVWHLGAKDSEKIRTGKMDQSGETLTSVATVCGMLATYELIIGTLFTCGGCLFSLVPLVFQALR